MGGLREAGSGVYRGVLARAVLKGQGGSGEIVPPSSSPLMPELRSEAELVALVQIRKARRLWERPEGGRTALAHRLAASLLFALLFEESRRWRLSGLVRDIVTLGEAALPESLTALVMMVEPLAGSSYRGLVERLAGSCAVAERRLREVIDLAGDIAREVAALP